MKLLSTATLAALLCLTARAAHSGGQPDAQQPLVPAGPFDDLLAHQAASKKRGLSFTDPSLTRSFNAESIPWAYDWDQTTRGKLPVKREFAPMLWGAAALHTDSWEQNAKAAIASGATHLLGFNEPDIKEQAHMSPQDAVSAWKTYMQPFAGKANLCSPAVSNGPDGQPWLDQFMKLCTGCTIDCIAFHTYDAATNIAYFKNYITEMGTRYNKPTWLTELGLVSGTDAEKEAFMHQILPFLDGLSSLQRYAYFTAASGYNILVDKDGNLTALGKIYNSA